MDYTVIKYPEILKERKIIVYGAGLWGRRTQRMLSEMGIEIECFCVTNQEKNISEYYGKKVCSIDEVINKENALFVIASELYWKEMEQELFVRKVENDNIITFFSIFYLYDREKMNDRIMRANVEKIHMRLDDFQQSNELMKIIHQCDEEGVVCIYQPGKVASSTVSHSLVKYGVETVHFHYMKRKRAGSRDNMVTSVVEKLESQQRQNENGFDDIWRQIEDWERKVKKCKIITMVREPIARDLSACFEVSKLDSYPLLAGAVLKQVLEDAVGAYGQCMDIYKVNTTANGFAFNEFGWFQTELQVVTGIDVFRADFDKEKGFSIIKNDVFEILIMQMEKLNELGSVIEGFLELKEFSMENKNEASSKISNRMYREFLKEVKLPRDYYEMYYGEDSYIHHFYSEEDIERFKKRWESHIV